jgi:DNA-binding MarR family transcriptional regulator
MFIPTLAPSPDRPLFDPLLMPLLRRLAPALDENACASESSELRLPDRSGGAGPEPTQMTVHRQPSAKAPGHPPEAAVELPATKDQVSEPRDRPADTDLLTGEIGVGSGGDGVNRRLPILLRRAWYGLNQAFRRRIAHTGSTPDQFTVMRNLAEGDPRGLTQSQLTSLMSSDPNTMAALIERMEAAGLIERRPHERDRRSHRIRLRPKGRGRYRRLVAVAIALQKDVLATLPVARRKLFLDELTLLADTCRAMAEGERRRPEG